jgi:hypothetical protein
MKLGCERKEYYAPFFAASSLFKSFNYDTVGPCSTQGQRTRVEQGPTVS